MFQEVSKVVQKVVKNRVQDGIPPNDPKWPILGYPGVGHLGPFFDHFWDIGSVTQRESRLKVVQILVQNDRYGLTNIKRMHETPNDMLLDATTFWTLFGHFLDPLLDALLK